jgi:hypothetical protein
MRRSAATSELVVSMISALGLYVRRRAFVASTFARSGTRSSLLRICKRKVVLVAARRGSWGESMQRISSPTCARGGRLQTHDLVRKGQLLLGLVLHALGAVAAELLVNVRRVHHGDDGVQVA